MADTRGCQGVHDRQVELAPRMVCPVNPGGGFEGDLGRPDLPMLHPPLWGVC